MENLKKLLDGSFLQFAGVVVAFLTIVVMFLIYFLQRNRKSLSYEIVSNVPLLTVREELEGKLQVLFESVPIKNLQLVIIRVFNSGNVPISSADYEHPLRFVFEESAKILSVEVIKKSPDDIVASVGMDQGKIEFAPTLLNSKDSITVKALVNHYKEGPKIEARIVGVRTIKESEPLTFKKISFVLSEVIVFSIWLFIYFSFPDMSVYSFVATSCFYFFIMFSTYVFYKGYD